MSTVAQAIGLFVVTNLDDVALLAVLFARGVPAARIVGGQYLGFALVLGVSVAAALGATLLPDDALRWLGLIPIAVGIKELLEDEEAPATATLAAIAFAGAADDLGVYASVFATVGDTAVYVVVFAVLVAPLCWAARWVSRRPAVAAAIARLGRFAVPAALMIIGVTILIVPSG